ncbi:MAG: phosphate signaling complex protein PhoU [Clostridia bacterium]|nr:phosphate signaling complex protein PhoU [Clostridia bacterium]
MRSHLERSLQELRDEIGRMGGLVEESVEKTIIALREMNEDLAKEIITRDDEIDNIETKIEKNCLSLFALQQPIARDLRIIGSSLKMITDLERIADHSADISELTIRLAKNKAVKLNPAIYIMADKARSMVSRSIDSFIKQDMNTAQAVCKSDDEVDDLFNEIILDVVNQIKAGSQEVELLIDIMFIVKYFERMADHATNISEWVVYSETGSHGHLQHPELHARISEENE